MPESICSVEECTRPAVAQGWCMAHYMRWKRHGDPQAGGSQLRSEIPVVQCSYEDCTRPARRGNTICRVHYTREWRARQGTCSVDGCDGPVSARKRCAAHYLRLMAGEPDRPVAKRTKREGLCTVEGCERPVYARQYCAMHNQRWRLTGDPGPANPLKAPDGAGSIDPKKGYRYITVDGHRVAEHRWVMEQMIGRPLESCETPHHKNGRRADNRPENLELWVKPQPAGQRVEDLVEFVVAHYPELVRQALG